MDDRTCVPHAEHSCARRRRDNCLAAGQRTSLRTSATRIWRVNLVSSSCKRTSPSARWQHRRSRQRGRVLGIQPGVEHTPPQFYTQAAATTLHAWHTATNEWRKANPAKVWVPSQMRTARRRKDKGPWVGLRVWHSPAIGLTDSTGPALPTMEGCSVTSRACGCQIE